MGNLLVGGPRIISGPQQPAIGNPLVNGAKIRAATGNPLVDMAPITAGDPNKDSLMPKTPLEFGSAAKALGPNLPPEARPLAAGVVLGGAAIPAIAALTPAAGGLGTATEVTDTILRMLALGGAGYGAGEIAGVKDARAKEELFAQGATLGLPFKVFGPAYEAVNQGANLAARVAGRAAVGSVEGALGGAAYGAMSPDNDVVKMGLWGSIFGAAGGQLAGLGHAASSEAANALATGSPTDVAGGWKRPGIGDLNLQDVEAAIPFQQKAKETAERSLKAVIIQRAAKKVGAIDTQALHDIVRHEGDEGLIALDSRLRTSLEPEKLAEYQATVDKLIQSPTIQKNALKRWTLRMGDVVNSEPLQDIKVTGGGFLESARGRFVEAFEPVKEFLNISSQANTPEMQTGRIFSGLLDAQEQLRARMVGEVGSRATPFINQLHGMKLVEREAIDAAIRDPEKLANLPDKARGIAEYIRAEMRDAMQNMTASKVHQIDELGNRVPIRATENYAPEMRDPGKVEEWLKNSSVERTALLDEVRTKLKRPSMTDEEALSYALRTMKNAGDWKGGIVSGFQHARILKNIPFEKDPAVWFPKWVESYAHSVSNARAFGGKEEIATRLLYNLERQLPGPEYNMVQNVYNSMKGWPNPVTPEARISRIAASTGVFDIGTGILQHSQMVPTIAQYGFKNTLKALVHAVQDPTGFIQATRQAGGLLDSEALSRATDVPSLWMKITGIKPFDSFQRGIGAFAAQFKFNAIANDIANSLHTGQALDSKTEGIYRRLLKGMGSDFDILKSQGGIPTREQTLTAMREGANTTQQRTSTLDLPLKNNTPTGWAYMMWRKFSTQQGHFVAKQIIGELKRGNPGPFARYFLGSLAVGVPTQAAMDVVRGRFDSSTLNTMRAVKHAIENGGDLSEFDEHDVANTVLSASVIGLGGIYMDMLKEAVTEQDPIKFGAAVAAGPFGGYVADVVGKPVLTAAGEGWKAATDPDNFDVQDALDAFTTSLAGAAQRAPLVGPAVRFVKNYQKSQEEGVVP